MDSRLRSCFQRLILSKHLTSFPQMICNLGYIFLFFTFSSLLSTSSVSVNLYKVTGQFPWSSLRETDRGVSTEISVNSFVN